MVAFLSERHKRFQIVEIADDRTPYACIVVETPWTAGPQMTPKQRFGGDGVTRQDEHGPDAADNREIGSRRIARCS